MISEVTDKGELEVGSCHTNWKVSCNVLQVSFDQQQHPLKLKLNRLYGDLPLLSFRVWMGYMRLGKGDIQDPHWLFSSTILRAHIGVAATLSAQASVLVWVTVGFSRVSSI